MRIATWNINGLRARLDFMRIWLAQRQPDVVGLQELKVTDDEFPADFFEALGYHVATHGQKAWNGVAVLSKKKAEVVDRGLTEQAELGARLLRVRVAEIDFTTVYCPNGKDVGHDDFPKKLTWLDSLVRYWATRDPQSTAILCGDFNVVPTALDSWLGADSEGEIFHTPEERTRFARLIDLGLVDLFRARHPESKTFSWWDYRGGAFHKGEGLRIDFVLGTQAAAARVKEVEIDRDFRKKKEGFLPSDHAPVIVDLAD